MKVGENKIKYIKEPVSGIEKSKRTKSFAVSLSLIHIVILVASGETDLITDGSCVYRCHNGSPMMARITAVSYTHLLPFWKVYSGV